MTRLRLVSAACAAAIVASGVAAGDRAAAQSAQDRLAQLPGYDAYSRMQQALRTPVVDPGAQNVVWAADSRSVTYRRDGRIRHFDLASMSETDAAGAAPAVPPPAVVDDPGSCPRTPIDRGRQKACAPSPDRAMKAYYRDRNLYLSRADGTGEVALTTDGSDASRVKYGTASWVYGEELDQVTAIWWAPSGRQVAFYRMNEQPVRDYYVLLNQTDIQASLDVEAYPKAGTANPIADVLVYDLDTRRTTTLDVRDGQPFRNDVVGHYVFAVEWAPDSSELRMHRTNRLQNVLEFVGCSPLSGKCRQILREERATGWVENRPTFRPLADGRRFIWASDRDGWRNYYLYEFSGRMLARLTHLRTAEAGLIVAVDERAGVLFYMANDGDNFLKAQLHRVRLDGTDDQRLTDPAFHHRVSVSPDSRYFIDVRQTHDVPPATMLMSTDGATLATIAAADRARFDGLQLRTVEPFTYAAADGTATLRGSIAKPTSFDPSRRYPVLISVYAGPESSGLTPSENFAVPPASTEFGFLVVTLGTRAMPGLGRRPLEALYRHLGRAEIDDLAAGVRALAAKPFVDPARVGIAGVSYGGYAALLSLLRYPDLFAAAVASSPVTDWRHYDTIYTERYMGLPDDNRDGYEQGSAIRYAGDLRGRLLLYFGTADNNVHPSNSLQLIAAFNRAGKAVDVQVGPDLGHSGLPESRVLQFFVEHLILAPERVRVP